MLALDRSSTLTTRQTGWLLLAIVLLGAGLRLFQLGEAPPGLYRDEAYNGLDALGVIEGEHALFFEANNGREPAYIYLTALSVRLFGQNTGAVRLPAALAGSITTLLVFGLGRAWFNRSTGLWGAFIWATTVWPIHLSRVGLRVILVIPLLTAAAWCATIAIRQEGRQQRAIWWAITGAVYGLSFYTYLVSRFTPAVLFGLLLIWLFIEREWLFKRLFPQSGWGAFALLITVFPWIWALIRSPDRLSGRTGQVSILNPEINKGDFWGTLWQHTGRSLTMYIWQGDDIIRHNPPGRPVFDPIIALFFILGLLICAVNWRAKPVQATLAWGFGMLGTTILAEDAPHFLRAAGVLPAACLIPAVGLSQMATWPKLVRLYRLGLITLICIGSIGFSVRDYFTIYNQSADTGYLFEVAARRLAESAETDAQDDAIVYIDQRYWEGWSSIPFLVQTTDRILPYTTDPGLSLSDTPPESIVVYAWPYDSAALTRLVQLLPETGQVEIESGELARGDLEPTPYPLYLRITSIAVDQHADLLAIWVGEDGSDAFQLFDTQVHILADNHLDFRLTGALSDPVSAPLTSFVHILDTETGLLIGQVDRPPLDGWVPVTEWPTSMPFSDNYRIRLSEPFDPSRHQILFGLYPSGNPDLRLNVVTLEREEIGTTWPVKLEEPIGRD